MRLGLSARTLAAMVALALTAGVAVAGPPRATTRSVAPATTLEDESEVIETSGTDETGFDPWRSSAVPSGGVETPCCDFGTCEPSWSGACCSRQGAWYGGGDYLLARPRFSQGVAYYVCTATPNTNNPPPTTQNYSAQAVEFKYNYRSGFRAFLGYHLWDCGGDIQFTYWNMQNNASALSGVATSSVDSAVNYCGQMGTMTSSPGQQLSANSNVQANIFDLDFAKCLSYGGPKGDCDACACPRWDLRWSAGVRGARITRTDNNELLNNPVGEGGSANSNARFSGAGPRVGLQGRRYFGDGRFSLFARGNQALLLGQYSQVRNAQMLSSTVPNTTNYSQNDTFNRMIPVSEIEIGGSYQLTPRFFVSAGWFFQCWWDLGFGETASNIVSGTPPHMGALDTANIMSWDGLFVRGELIF